MRPFHHLRRLLPGLLAAFLLAAAAASLPAQKTLTVKPDTPGMATNHRLILKDGTYQLVRKYEIVGDRVRYISIERSGDWEELPFDLVDWDATRKWERDHAAQPEESSDAMKEAAAIDKEEAAEREDAKARRPEVAKGLELPDEDGVFALDTYEGNPELVEMMPSELNANTKSKHGLATLNPMASNNASLELDGAHAKVHLHVNDPVLYLSLNARDDAEQVVSHAMTVNTSGAKEVASRKHGAHSASSGFAVVRVDARRAIRIVGAIHMSPNGTVTQDEDIIPAKVDVLPGKHWLKITPSQQLTIGEYALVEIISSSDINQSVWDFRIDPQLGDNEGSLGPARPERRRLVSLLFRIRRLGPRKLNAPPLPLLRFEEPRAYVDEAGNHVEDRDPAPRPPVSHAEALLVQVAHNGRIAEVLHQQLHHQHQRLVLLRVHFKPPAVVGDAQPVGDVFIENAFGRRFGVRQLAPPLDRHHLPPRRRPLLDDVGAERH
jgi:hypothetical protein